MRIATWNVNSIVPRLPRVLDWLEHAAPDVLCVQELKNTTEAFPAEEVKALGYDVAAYGLGRWNGVAIVSRVGLDDVVRGLAGEPQFDGASEARAVGATCGGVRVWSVYVPNGREPDNPHYAYKLEWLEALRTTLAAELSETPFAVLGDFNVAPTDADVWDRSLFDGSTHVTEPERAALARLRDLGLADVFPRPLKYDHPFTYWDYRAGNFPNNRGMRIDLVYGNEPFATAVRDSYVDREARKGKGPSDHAPIVVDLEL
ncbi:exodeoxyribonuclease III [Amycolatopsis carbonis]|uniref:Exodeoxyribonuclease III n=1 Tax=Amycolatopsis carbonis TaxID=715471 RepID=A0A9Y2MR65_9PSEU|nr:exodeoxyribonuclease III [Amycolatopsis sp. 2-15]WIX78100.1 exodeoxyribonuclease III [Amycolatopsis sp. 2-15]